MKIKALPLFSLILASRKSIVTPRKNIKQLQLTNSKVISIILLDPFLHSSFLKRAHTRAFINFTWLYFYMTYTNIPT